MSTENVDQDRSLWDNHFCDFPNRQRKVSKSEVISVLESRMLDFDKDVDLYEILIINSLSYIIRSSKCETWFDLLSYARHACDLIYDMSGESIYGEFIQELDDIHAKCS